MCAAAATGVDAVMEAEARMAGVSPEMHRIRQLEELEGGTPTPHLAGGPSAVDKFIEEAVGKMGQLFHLAAAMDEDETLKSIADARRSPEWEGEGGWKQCTEDGLVRCIDTHGALVLRSEEHYKSLLDRLGDDKVHTQKLVLVFKQKWLAKNVKDRKKMRLTVGDEKRKFKVENTFAPTVGYDSTRFLIQLGVLRGSRRTTKDVGGAYLFGTPTPPRGGRGALPLRPGPAGLRRVRLPGEGRA